MHVDPPHPGPHLPPLHPPNPLQLGHGDTSDANTPTLVPALSRGTIDVDALAQAARPVVAYSVAASDRYAVVPDSAPGDGETGDGAVPGTSSVPDAKRQKV